MKHPFSQIVQDLAGMSGVILWRVKVTWANKGRLGDTDQIVEARDAIEAAELAWCPEDPRDLRTIFVEWLCPVESIIRSNSPEG